MQHLVLAGIKSSPDRKTCLVKLFQDLVVGRCLVAVNALAADRLVAILFVAGAVANALNERQAIGKC
jgi:hypothetical protein